MNYMESETWELVRLMMDKRAPNQIYPIGYDLYESDIKHYVQLLLKEEENKMNDTTKVNAYKKKPVQIEAIQYNGDNLQQLFEFVEEALIVDNGQVRIRTLEGDMLVRDNAFVIQGVDGEFYPCDEEIFYKTYESVNDK